MSSGDPDRMAGAGALARRLRAASGDEAEGDELDAWLARALGAPREDAYWDEVMAALCDLALSGQGRRRRLGASLLFGGVAERLADAFDPGLAALYDRLFARVIDHCRRAPGGRDLDDGLARLGLRDGTDLLARRARMRAADRLSEARLRRVRTVIVPSRVTLGADVAVTSIVLQRVARDLPWARCVVLGPAVVAELLAGLSTGVEFREVAYERRGDVLGRLEAWVAAVGAVERETAGAEAGTCLVLDPDSRITQLGLLPLAPAEVACAHFESRAYRRPGAESLGQLAGCWLDDVLGPGGPGTAYPRLVVDPVRGAQAQRLAAGARGRGDGHVTALALGVGGNPRKRLGEGFELALVRGLLARGGCVVVDKGIEEEVGRMEALVARLAAEGWACEEVGCEGLALPEGGSARLLVHHCGLGSLLAVVAASDLYVGYDSALQHVAAGVEVPSIDVFVDPPGEMFARRWQPFSRVGVTAIAVRTGAGERVAESALADVLAAFDEHRAVGRGR